MSGPPTQLASPAELALKAMTLSCAGDRFGPIYDAIDATAATGGELWECGCYKGGSALLMKARLMERGMKRTVRMFDTFTGLPYSGMWDCHLQGTMKADHAACVALFDGLDDCHIYWGVMPATFAGLESSVISVAHIDVDQYQGVKECLEWLYPRVHAGGCIVIDDYNCGSCPGARKAVDEFLRGKAERLIIAGQPNPQAYFIKV